ncbi:uncharacterized protein EV420DRAFT_1649699 [Desarmillaria tabescens]|uniref:Uncharacterized protein n=1 Tax=Armillaria tabescens TaxID=1929756 RepID=A0AA39JGU7_ARMTA|nr:uncharacterized protein EV420DRAFT_1649699 [Desarmillaria tabescens]KAK0442536.1 hypothetical protein EV420DRAFT_1649699 [Desarmillaria tabescens]
MTRQCVLFLKQHVSRETRWRQGEDLPYHPVYRLSVLRTSNICCSLTAIGNWNTTSPVRIPGKRFYYICKGSQRMKRRPRTTRKSRPIRTARNPHRLAIRIKAQTFPNAASKGFSTASERELITTFFNCLPGFTFNLADKELGEIAVHRILHKVQNSRFSSILTVILDLITGGRDRQQHRQRILRSPRLEFLCPLVPESISFHSFSVYPRVSIITEAVVIKKESKRLLTDHSQSVESSTVSWKLNWTEKTEHDQLNQCVRFINSSTDVPSDGFITPIAVSPGIPSGYTEISLLARSTGLLALTAPLSEVDIEASSLKRCLQALGNEVKDTESSRQCPKENTISSVIGTMAESIRWQYDGIINIILVLETALADSRTKPSSIHLSPELRFYLSKHKGSSNPLQRLSFGIHRYTCLLLLNKFQSNSIFNSCNGKKPASNAISEGDRSGDLCVKGGEALGFQDS